jgi:uncharacterized protein YeaO (DUF488 family)
MKPTIHIKRAYEKSSETDGFRVLADRLWPRGVTKEEANIDEWAKDVAPSTELREWFGHDPEKWATFQKKYLHELEQNEAMEQLVENLRTKKTVTLVYAAKDEQHTHAIVLQHYLEKLLAKR